jgi:hypothetical protein
MVPTLIEVLVHWMPPSHEIINHLELKEGREEGTDRIEAVL